jgi:hypothetical protein
VCPSGLRSLLSKEKIACSNHATSILLFLLFVFQIVKILSIHILMKLKELKDHWKDIRAELDELPDVFISEKPRPTGEWEGSELLKEVVAQYTSGKCGWLKGGQDHVQEDWISWPLIWAGKPVLGNCLKCPKTYALLSQINGIHIAGICSHERGCKVKGAYRPSWI